MASKCDVLIWGKKMGELAYSANHRLIFIYTDKPPFEISPLHLNTNDTQFDYTLLEQQKGLAGVFADSLPDIYGDGVLKKYFDKLNIEANVIDKLLFIGDETMGAITYEPVKSDVKSKQQIMTLQNLYKEINKLNTEDLSVSTYILKSISSIGGAKPKAAIGFKDFKSDIFIGSKNVKLPKDYRYCIVKFNTEKEGAAKDDLIVEHIYMNLAKKVDIDTPKTLLSKDGHFVIERFDRTKEGKLHMHTLQGFLHSNFSTPRTVDYLSIFTSMQDLQIPQKDFEQMYRRMIFNYMFRNHDDHEKNHSFIMDKKGNWRLSPAYDLTYCYKKNEIFASDHELTFNRKIGNNISYLDFEIIAKKFNIKNYKEIIEQIKNLREDNLSKELKKYNIDKDKISEIENAISERDIKLPLMKRFAKIKQKKELNNGKKIL